MSSLQAPPSRIVPRAIEKERAIAEAEVLHKRWIAHLDLHLRYMARLGVVLLYRFIAAYEAFVALADDPSLAPSGDRDGRRLAPREGRSASRGRGALEDASFDNGADGRVHPRAVAARGKHGELHRADR
jgi:hypothetical protein